MSVVVLKVGVVLCWAWSESQWTVLVRYFTISANVSCYQTRCRWQYYLPFSNIACACTSAWCVQQSSTAAAQNSTSFNLSYGHNKPELNSVHYKISGVYSSVNMSCKLTRLKKSSSDWLNSGNAVIQHLRVKMRFLCFCVLPGSAEALLRWSGKIKHSLTACCLGNIPSKNYQNRLM